MIHSLKTKPVSKSGAAGEQQAYKKNPYAGELAHFKVH
jgi:hypothetical protein